MTVDFLTYLLTKILEYCYDHNIAPDLLKTVAVVQRLQRRSSTAIGVSRQFLYRLYIVVPTGSHVVRLSTAQRLMCSSSGFRLTLQCCENSQLESSAYVDIWLALMIALRSAA